MNKESQKTEVFCIWFLTMNHIFVLKPFLLQEPCILKTLLLLICTFYLEICTASLSRPV